MLYAILATLILYGIFLYNNLIKLKNNVENAFSDIDVVLKNRFNLIENLVNTIK
jgi:LemA protein